MLLSFTSAAYSDCASLDGGPLNWGLVCGSNYGSWCGGMRAFFGCGADGSALEPGASDDLSLETGETGAST